jgi:hypothetical protein
VNAREFVVRIVPELAYVFSLPAQVLRKLRAARGEPEQIPLGLDVLGSCVKEGFDRPEKLALRYRKGLSSRRAAHREFSALEMFLAPPEPNEDFTAVKRRVRTATEIADFLQ